MCGSGAAFTVIRRKSVRKIKQMEVYEGVSRRKWDLGSIDLADYSISVRASCVALQITPGSKDLATKWPAELKSHNVCISHIRYAMEGLSAD